MGQRRAGMRPFHLSAPVYFMFVAILTALGIGIAMWLRPAFGYSVRAMLWLERPAEAAPHSFYAIRIAPLFEEHCTSCHGERRQKGDLRLDSFAAALRGGKLGAVIRAGDVKGSELFTRITLPPQDEKAMPPSDKAPLSADEVKVVRLWIAAGASGVLAASAIKGAPKPVPRIEFPEIDEAAVLKARAPLAEIVQRWQARFPGALTYESRGSADVQLNASLLGRSFNDKTLAELAPLSKYLVSADLSGTAVTDTSAPILARCTKLRALRLANTPVTDITARVLLALPALKVLTVTDTGMTDEGVASLRAKSLRVYDGKVVESDAGA